MGLGVVGLAVLCAWLFLDQDQSLRGSALGTVVILSTWFLASHAGVSFALRRTSHDPVRVATGVAASLIVVFVGVGVLLGGTSVEWIALGILLSITAGTAVAVTSHGRDGTSPGAAD